MIPRILSFACPLFVYVTLGTLVAGLWRERKKLEWPAFYIAAAGLAASFIVLVPVHRLFFDEDIYVSIAQNLTRTPIAQITVLGSPDDVQVSSYYKEPSGWPVILSLVFMITGRSEAAAFWVARILFAISIAAVYQLCRQALETRRQAVVGAILFAATPVCFWFSPSAGADIPAALFGVLGMWGVFAGNGMLAASGLALAAQTRLELMILVPLVWLAPKVSWKWKLSSAAFVAAEVIHIGWVFSIAPALEAAEKVESAFSLNYLWGNLTTNTAYLLNPAEFPIGITILGIAGIALSLWERAAPRSASPIGRSLKNGRRVRVENLLLLCQLAALFGVYLLFYAGSFNLNPRYTIQFLAPLTLFAASLSKRMILAAALLLSAAIPYWRPLELPIYVQALAADHRISLQTTFRLQPEDMVMSTDPEMFLNAGHRIMNAIFVSENKNRLEQELRARKVVYHSGVRTNIPESVEWRVDQWVKSNFELHLIESHEIRGMRIAFYDVYSRTSTGKLDRLPPSTDRAVGAHVADADSKIRYP